MSGHTQGVRARRRAVTEPRRPGGGGRKAARDGGLPIERALDELTRAEQDLDALVANTLDEESVARRVLAAVYALTRFDSAGLYMSAGETRFVALGMSRRGEALTVPLTQSVLSLDTLPLLHELVVQREPMYLPDVKQVLTWRAHLPGQHAGSWFAAPLVSGGTLVGLVCLGHARRDFFSVDARARVCTLAPRVAVLVHNLRLEGQWKESARKLSAVTRQVLQAQEEERKRVSRELHDEAGQSLTALTLNLKLLQQDLASQPEEVRVRTEETVAMARQTLDQLRRLAALLRPPMLEEVGLESALAQLCRDRAQLMGLEVEYRAAGLEALDIEVSLAMYRVVQEALTNVARHAAATRVRVEVRQSAGELCVTVSDNGRGFHWPGVQTRERQRTLGLLGMQERLHLLGGELEIRSKLRVGTVLRACVPVPLQGASTSADISEEAK